MADLTDVHIDIEHRVRHHPPGPAAVAAHQAMREAVADLAHFAVDTCPPSPELDRALRRLTDDVLAGFNAAIARHADLLPAPPDGS